MKRLLLLFIASILALLSSHDANAQFSKLSIGDYGIKSISPESFRAVSGSVWMNVTNPEEGFTLSEISGLIYKNNVPFVQGAASNVRVSKGSSKLIISGRASLCTGVSLWSVLSVLSFNPDDYCVDIKMKVTMDSGQSRIISKQKMPLSTLLKLR